jgi:UDP-3-O-[3-hydroxymyristoyl] N-acetylglucosamine deacetylase/3-hydroxyacyl-[acyl-carrier-protein] dehydratase
MIKEAKIVRRTRLAPIRVARTVFFQVRESIITVLPDSKFRVSCTQVGPGGRFTQYLSAEVTPDFYETEIASARTFVFYEDVKPLMDKGLIKGGSIENAIVARGDAVLSKEPLRFPDEFVRHKILDLVGDLILSGRRLRGHVVAVKPGHGPNTEVARSLVKRNSEYLAMAPRPVAAAAGVLDINEIMRTLPHRYPFLMVDRVVEFQEDRKAIGVKTVTINEPYFQGHFRPSRDDHPVLQVEIWSGQHCDDARRRTRKISYFMSADAVKFRKPVFPGDTLFIHCEMLSMKRRLGKAACKCLVNQEVVSEAELLFGLVDQ